VRVRTLRAFIGSLTILATATAATPAVAASTGGAAAGTTTTSKTTSKTTGTAAPATPTPAIHLSPIVSKSTHIAYNGPLYEKTATGEVVPYQAPAAAGALTTATGGSPVGTTADTKPDLLVPGSLARYVNGLAAAPMAAPASVQQVIWTANQIIGLPYIFGGGHASFISPGYDCSGTVSFALHGGNLLATPEDSSEFMAWGSHGAGRWIAVFGNAGHAYMDVAGLRLDTSAADDPTNQQGPRWRPLRPGNEGFTVRHPLGL
jgi:cell wall-associated NlpC family hydrolase